MFVRWGSTAVVAVGILGAFACGGSTNGQEATNPPSSDEASAGTSCESLSESASTEVSSAIAAHQACTVDDDCTQVELVASCFDHCSRIVAKDGVAEVSAAKDRVNAAQCKRFLAQGCKFDVPPCSPPMPAKCKAGVCG
ncbi:hypothetical protein AKJ09_04159 [Labilithrix luteola]|uniref:Secreted protein n=2 Tax=Labilithrix luteola TaxID=1391654 RepID=A0A0K1PVD9_9BACT|nr:hypothetical protein AKJ09_04159 [Labilithrix luteola]